MAGEPRAEPRLWPVVAVRRLRKRHPEPAQERLKAVSLPAFSGHNRRAGVPKPPPPAKGSRCPSRRWYLSGEASRPPPKRLASAQARRGRPHGRRFAGGGFSAPGGHRRKGSATGGVRARVGGAAGTASEPVRAAARLHLPPLPPLSSARPDAGGCSCPGPRSPQPRHRGQGPGSRPRAGPAPPLPRRAPGPGHSPPSPPPSNPGRLGCPARPGVAVPAPTLPLCPGAGFPSGGEAGGERLGAGGLFDLGLGGGLRRSPEPVL